MVSLLFEWCARVAEKPEGLVSGPKQSWTAHLSAKMGAGPEVKERAAAVLEELGITVSEAVRILLTRTANEGTFAIRPD
jgi:hypothetical protein